MAPRQLFSAICVLLAAVAACGGRVGDDVIGSSFDDDAGARDAQADSAVIDAGPTGPAPRPIAPLSTSRVTSRRPTLHWALPSGVTTVTIDLCLDRACSRPIGAPLHINGTSAMPTSDLPTGVVFWRLHPRESTVATSATWQFTVGARSAPIDSSWGTTLDVNGDGFADVVVGADDSSATGRAYVYLGGPAGLATSPATTLVGPDGANGVFGYTSSTSAGDVNGDGYADLVVGAEGVASYTGHIYVYLGGANGLATSPAITIAGPDGKQSYFGQGLASAGDVNGDGYADVIVGALGVANYAGSAYVYLGSASGLASTPATTLTSDGGGYGYFGASAASAGDVNGDGYADVVIGAPMISGVGRAYIYLGSAAGLPVEPVATLSAPEGAGGYFGISVANAGDLNGDGYADVVVGCDEAAASAGMAYVYLGSAGGFASTASATMSVADDVVGYYGNSVASAGDVDGDGYADLAIGAWVGSYETGRAYVYRGSASGVVTTPIATFSGAGFGYAVASAGDVNGDGHADLVIGALSDGPNGGAYLYLGNASGLGSTASTSLSDPAGGDYFGAKVFGATN